MNTHQLLVKNVFSISEDLLSLSSTRLFSFSLSSDILSQSHHTGNSSLLLQPNELLREVIHGLRDDISLESLRDTVKDSLLVLLNECSFLFEATGGLPLLSGSQLRNKIKSLLLTFEHHILLSSSSDESLQQDDCSSSLISLFVISLALLRAIFFI